MEAITKKKRGGEACSAINCSQSRRSHPDKSFFRFPKDEERCKLWVRNSRRQDLVGKPSVTLYSYVLCDDHFHESQFRYVPFSNQRKRLLPGAIPTIFDFSPPTEHQMQMQQQQQVPSGSSKNVGRGRKRLARFLLDCGGYGNSVNEQSVSKKDIISTEGVLGVEQECPAWSSTPDVPGFGSRGSQTEGPDVTGTCLQVAVYILTTMPEFQSIQFEVRELPSREPVLHVRRADLYGVLGWPCDPVTCTLSLDGLFTHRVVYLPPRSISMGCEDVVLDVDQFITEMRWLMSLKNVCTGINSGCLMTTKDSLPSIQIFSSPQPRIQSTQCPVVLEGGRKKCISCGNRTQFLRKKRRDGKDFEAMASGDVVLPVFFEDDAKPPANKKPRLSLDLVLTERMKTVLKDMLGVQTDNGGSRAQDDSREGATVISSLGKDTRSLPQQNSKADVSQQNSRADISLQTLAGDIPHQKTKAVLSLAQKLKVACPTSSQQKPEAAHPPRSVARKSKKSSVDATSPPLEMDCETVSTDSVKQDYSSSTDQRLSGARDSSTKVRDSSAPSQKSAAFSRTCKTSHTGRGPQVEVAEDVRLLQDVYSKLALILPERPGIKHCESCTASCLCPSVAGVWAPPQSVQPIVPLALPLSLLHPAFPQLVLPLSPGALTVPQVAQSENMAQMLQSQNVAAQMIQSPNLPQMIQSPDLMQMVQSHNRPLQMDKSQNLPQLMQSQDWQQMIPSQHVDSRSPLSGPQSSTSSSSQDLAPTPPVPVSLSSSNDVVFPVAVQDNTRIKREPDDDNMEVRAERAENGEDDYGSTEIAKASAYDQAVGAGGEWSSLSHDQSSSRLAVVSSGLSHDQGSSRSVTVLAGHSLVKQEPREIPE